MTLDDDVIIRTMTEDDLEAVFTIQSLAYANYFMESKKIIAARFSASKDTSWIAEIAGQTSAYLVGYWSNIGKVNCLGENFFASRDGDCLYLHDLAIDARLHGQGLAKQLIKTAEKKLAEKHSNTMALVSVQNSKKFWQKIGFSEVWLDVRQRENLESYGTNAEAFYIVKTL